MKICLITSMHEWNDDRIFERTAVGLSDNGHEVVYVVPAERDFVSSGVKIHAIPKRTRLFKHIIGPWEAFLKARKLKADAYHFFNPNLMPLMILFSVSGKKVFVDIHENYEARVQSLWPGRFWVRLYRNFENFLCRFFNGITVVTASMKVKLSSSNRPILVMDNVPYLKALEGLPPLGEKESNPTIITSGTNSEARNCLNAVRALPKIKERIPNVQMKFVGRFSPRNYEDEIRNEAKELNVEDHLMIEGMLPWLENFERVSKAHIGCVFYEDNLNNRYTLPNRLYEYMYCGLAVIGENFPEVKNVLDLSNSGETVDSNDPEDIAEKLIHLLEDELELNAKTQNARRAVENRFNFDLLIPELVDFYSKS